jgi:hypothetical protein
MIYATYYLHRSLPWGRGDRVVADHAKSSPVVRGSEKAQLESAQLAVWACLDNLVPGDGDRILVGLAEGWNDRCSNAALPAATIPQCRVVRTVLPAKVTGTGFWRNCRFVVSHPGDNDRILESGSGRRLAALAILSLGWLRDSTQLFDLTIERLMMFVTTIGISH